MSCRILEQNLEAYLEGELTESERGVLERHIESCPDCGRLLSIASGTGELPAADDEFVRSVLEQTGGSACVGARQLLCDHVDGLLDPRERDLLAAHFDNCTECMSLAAALYGLQNELPAMAEIDPGPGFTAAVLRRLVRPKYHRATPRQPMREWWMNLVRRPRFSWEAAYVLTLLLVLAFGNPLSPSYGSFRNLTSTRWERMSSHVPQVLDRCAEGSMRSLNGLATGVSKTTGQVTSVLRQELANVRVSPDRLLEQAKRLWREVLSWMRGEK